MEEENLEELDKDMTPILLKDLGMRFTSEAKKYKARYGLYQCPYCGKEFEGNTYDVKRRDIRSCGCLSTQKLIERSTSHGLGKHPMYQIWYNMKYRCYNHKDSCYKDYGGRGIKVCDRWLDINNFIEDMFPSWEEGLSIDRIDVEGNYEPANCRWATTNIQARNTRDTKSNNTSGFRGVCWHKATDKWMAGIVVNNRQIYLGVYHTALEAAKAYETYVRLNNLEHNFTPALTEDEIEVLLIK